MSLELYFSTTLIPIATRTRNTAIKPILIDSERADCFGLFSADTDGDFCGKGGIEYFVGGIGGSSNLPSPVSNSPQPH
jgi:hypothetical protein